MQSESYIQYSTTSFYRCVAMLLLATLVLMGCSATADLPPNVSYNIHSMSECSEDRESPNNINFPNYRVFSSTAIFDGYSKSKKENIAISHRLGIEENETSCIPESEQAPSTNYSIEGIGMIIANGGLGIDRALCTGALIAPELVLTATHCMTGTSKMGNPSEYSSFKAEKWRKFRFVLPTKGEYAVDRVFPFCSKNVGSEVDPDWTHCKLDDVNQSVSNNMRFVQSDKGYDDAFTLPQPYFFGDLAIVKLADKVRGVGLIPIAALVPQSTEIELGESGDIPAAALPDGAWWQNLLTYSGCQEDQKLFVGYGHIPSLSAGSAGLRRIKCLTVGEELQISANTDGSKDLFRLPIHILGKSKNDVCPGDSGGPILSEQGIVGVISQRFASNNLNFFGKSGFGSSRCLNFFRGDDSASAGYIVGLLAKWIEMGIKDKGSVALATSQKRTAIEQIHGRFDHFSRFRQAKQVESIHEYEFVVPTEWQEKANKNLYIEVVVSVLAEIGAGTSLLSARPVLNSFRVTVLKNSSTYLQSHEPMRYKRNNYTKKWELWNIKHLGANKFPGMRLYKIQCLDGAMQTYSHCSFKMKIDQSPTNNRFNVAVNREFGFGAYQLTATMRLQQDDK